MEHNIAVNHSDFYECLFLAIFPKSPFLAHPFENVWIHSCHTCMLLYILHWGRPMHFYNLLFGVESKILLCLQNPSGKSLHTTVFHNGVQSFTLHHNINWATLPWGWLFQTYSICGELTTQETNSTECFFPYTCTLQSYLWCGAQGFITQYKSWIGVVLCVLAFNEMFQMKQGRSFSFLHFNYVCLKDVHLHIRSYQSVRLLDNDK